MPRKVTGEQIGKIATVIGTILAVLSSACAIVSGSITATKGIKELKSSNEEES